MSRQRRGAPDLPPGPARDLVDLYARLRRQSGITMAQVATRTTLSAGHVSDVVNGWKGPSPDTAARLATTLRGTDHDIEQARMLAEQLVELNRHNRNRDRRPTPPVRPISGLPRMDPHFVDRSVELRRVVGALDDGAVRRLCVVHGMAGAGKTALAVRAADAVAATYPDGTVFLDLHGYAENRPPLTIADALDRLLRRLRVDGASIPPDADERAALYRDHLTDRRMLIVLDNAYDTAQVRPLLPGTADCGVIVTSRRRLAALDEAVPVPVGALDPGAAADLFRVVAGDERLRGEPDPGPSIRRIVACCASLPLAVRIAAGQYRVREKQTLSRLETQLSDAHEALRGLADDERDMAAALRVSLADLPAEPHRTFGLLAVAPGTDFDAYASAALCDRPVAVVAQHLYQLADRHLIVEHTPGRYRFHDLVAMLAREHATAPESRHRALGRLADYYLRAADRATFLITPHRYRLPHTTLDRPCALPELVGYDAALDWLAVEHTNLTAIVVAAGAARSDVVCWQLAHTLRGYYFLTKDWQSCRTAHEAALEATRRAGDERAEAMILNTLGLARLEQGQRADAAAHYEQAHKNFLSAGDRHGAHAALANLAWLAFADGRYTDFLDEMRPVLAFHRRRRSSGDRAAADRHAAITLRGIGLAETALGRITEAVTDLRRALDIFERLALDMDTTMTWNALGEAYRSAGDDIAAAGAFTAALDVGDRAGSAYERARAHHGLGAIAHDAGDRHGAREHWTAALADYRRVGAPAAVAIRGALAALDATSKT